MNITLNCNTDFATILLGGLFGLSTISVAILSLASNFIQNSMLGIPSTILFRYRPVVLFSPVFILIFYVLCNLISEMDKNYLITFTILFSSYFFIISYLILEPFYNIKNFKKLMFIKKYKQLRKNINNTKNSEEKKKIVISCLTDISNENLNKSDINIKITEEELKEWIKKTLTILDTKYYSKNDVSVILETLKKIISKDYFEYVLSINFEFETVIISIFESKSISETEYKEYFYKFKDIIALYQNKRDIKNIVMSFEKMTYSNSIFVKDFINLIYNEKNWDYINAPLLSELITYLYNDFVANSSFYKKIMSEEEYKRIEKYLISFYKNDYINTDLSSEFISILKSCRVLGGDSNV